MKMLSPLEYILKISSTKPTYNNLCSTLDLTKTEKDLLRRDLELGVLLGTNYQENYEVYFIESLIREIECKMK